MSIVADIGQMGLALSKRPNFGCNFSGIIILPIWALKP